MKHKDNTNYLKNNMDSKLKIAMLGHKRIPSREGGIEIVVEELSTRMVKRGHDVTCFNRKGHHVCSEKYDSDYYFEYKGVELKKIPTLDYKGLAAMTSSICGSIILAFKNYDVLHFHAEGTCVMLWFPKLLGKKCVVTIHGLDHRRAKWGRIARLYILLGEKCAARFADEIIVLSKGVQKYFKDTYNRNTTYIPNGVNPPKIRKSNLIYKDFCLMRNSYILYLGRIVPEKGIQYLIKAFKQISTDKKLVIAGGTSDSDEFVQRLKKMASDDERIIFTGFVQGELLDELYSNAYIYVLPSDLEGMPLSLLEAMSYGNCCLTSNIPECIDVIKDNGVLFEKKSITDLYTKINWLIDNPDIVNRYKKISADYICNQFDWDSIVDETLNLYIN